MKLDPKQLRLDRMAVRYLEARDRGDLETIADLWSAAATDPELERLLHELNDELAATPRPVRRRARVGLAAALVAAGIAACVAALVWPSGEKPGSNGQQAATNSRPMVDPPLASGPETVPSASNLSRAALLDADLRGAELPAFAWPFQDSPVVHGSPAIPADLLN